MTNGAQIEVFQYPPGPDSPALPMWEGWGQAEVGPGHAGQEYGRPAAEAAMRGEFEKRLAEETRKGFDAGRERGRQEGRQAEREAQAGAQVAAAEQRTRQAAEMIKSFHEERDRFLRRRRSARWWSWPWR